MMGSLREKSPQNSQPTTKEIGPINPIKTANTTSHKVTSDSLVHQNIKDAVPQSHQSKTIIVMIMVMDLFIDLSLAVVDDGLYGSGPKE